VKNLVSEEEISEVAKLMKINLEDHSDHVKRVQKMLEYFDILDNANVESEEIIVQEIDLGKLRDDKYNQYDKNLLKFLKSYQGKYVKAPKLN
jgi:aspartyl-tRNA(Asn)/glutamyl-tRNA(Gln) amidotransferase subunit C